MAVMTVVALFYYAGVARSLWLGTPPDGAPEPAPQRISPPLGAAIALSTAGVLVLGVLPNLLVQYAPVSTLVAGP
jgi:NADH:ubiquinone oxidoreductase subunit 2 (subunit N)